MPGGGLLCRRLGFFPAVWRLLRGFQHPDAGQLIRAVVLQLQKLHLLPVPEGPADIILSVVKSVGDERDRQLLCAAFQAAQKIQIDLYIFSICFGHVVIHKKIRDQRMTAVLLLAQNKSAHLQHLSRHRHSPMWIGTSKYLYCSTLPDKKKQAFCGIRRLQAAARPAAVHKRWG